MILNIKKINLVIHILRKSFKKYKWRFLLILVLGLLSGLSGAVGIGAVIPLFSILTDQPVEDFDVVSRYIRDFFLFFHIPFNLFSVVIFMAILFILKAAIKFLAQYVNEVTAVEYEHKMRSGLFNRTMHASWPYLIESKMGHIEKILMKEVFISSGIINQLSSLILLITSFATYAFVAFNISAPITLITILFGVILFFLFKPLLYKIKKVSKETAETERSASNLINESMLGVKK